MKTLADLKQGTVVNFNRPVTVDNINYIVLRHLRDGFGSWVELLNIATNHKRIIAGEVKVEGFWTVVKN